MSSMETIDESRKQRLQLQADISLTQLELNKRKNNVAKLEAQIRAIEDGDEGSLIRLAQVIKSTAGMDGLKKQSEDILKNVGTLLNVSVAFQSKLQDYLLDQINTLSETDKNGPQKDGKTFQEKFGEASAKVKKQAEEEADPNGAR